MSDVVVRFVAENFTNPNIDSTKRRSPHYDSNAGELSIQNKALTVFFTQKIKQGGGAVLARTGRTSGNRTLQRNLEFVNDVGGDLSTIAVGFGAGGLGGAGIAVGAVAYQKGVEAWDIGFERRIETIDSDEQARRAGYINIAKGGEYR